MVAADFSLLRDMLQYNNELLLVGEFRFYHRHNRKKDTADDGSRKLAKLILWILHLQRNSLVHFSICQNDRRLWLSFVVNFQLLQHQFEKWSQQFNFISQLFYQSVYLPSKCNHNNCIRCRAPFTKFWIFKTIFF